MNSQFEIYMVENDLNDHMQSAYQEYHSTETALVKVHNDNMEAVDGGSYVILVLLDLSAPFDTVDHAIMLHRLEKSLLWFKSYLSSRTQRVYIKGTSSDDRPLKYGVPKVQSLDPNCSRYTIFMLEILLGAMVYNIIYKPTTMICTLLLNHHLIRTLTYSIEP